MPHKCIKDSLFEDKKVSYLLYLLDLNNEVKYSSFLLKYLCGSKYCDYRNISTLDFSKFAKVNRLYTTEDKVIYDEFYSSERVAKSTKAKIGMKSFYIQQKTTTSPPIQIGGKISQLGLNTALSFNFTHELVDFIDRPIDNLYIVREIIEDNVAYCKNYIPFIIRQIYEYNKSKGRNINPIVVFQIDPATPLPHSFYQAIRNKTLLKYEKSTTGIPNFTNAFASRRLNIPNVVFVSDYIPNGETIDPYIVGSDRDKLAKFFSKYNSNVNMATNERDIKKIMNLIQLPLPNISYYVVNTDYIDTIRDATLFNVSNFNPIEIQEHHEDFNSTVKRIFSALNLFKNITK